MIRHLLVSAVASGALLGMAGCKHKCCSADGPGSAPRPFLPYPPPSTIPPAGVPVTPGTSVVPSVGPGGLPPAELPPAAPAPAPAPAGGREPLLPDPIPGGPSSRSSYPSAPKPGVLGGPIAGTAAQAAEPPVAKKVLLPPTTAPVGAVAGVPGFIRLKDGVATGRRPELDGFDALKQAGYRTAIYLHPAGADVSAAREVAEKRGLAFVAVETTPEKLPAALDAVNAAVAERATKPVYVFDDNGVRAGAVWYLHFRTVDLESAEVAKIRARAIGLDGDGDDAKAFRAAVPQVLATR